MGEWGVSVLEVMDDAGRLMGVLITMYCRLWNIPVRSARRRD